MMRLLPLAAMLVALAASLAPAGAQDERKEREAAQLQSRLERLREEAEATRRRAENVSDTLIDIAGDEAKLNERLLATSARVSALEEQIAEDELALETLVERQASIRQSLAAERAELAGVLMALQRIGRRPPPALIGEADGPLSTVRGAILLNAVIPVLDGKARELAEKLAEATRLAGEEQTRWARLRTDLERVETERARLGELGEELERRRALSVFERDRAAADLARLAEEEDSVESLLARLSRGAPLATGPAGRAFQTRRGTLAQPVAGSVVAEYGDPTDTGGRAEGRTIAALPGSTVFAPMPASVVYSAPFRSYGSVLILDAGNGYHVVLAGLDETLVSPGDKVVTGAPLGRMGQSGRRAAVASAGVKGSALLGARPALYVELRKDGTAFDSHGWWRAPGSARGQGSPELQRTGG